MDERRLRHDGKLKIRAVILALPEAHDFLFGCNKTVAYPLKICHSGAGRNPAYLFNMFCGFVHPTRESRLMAGFRPAPE